MSQTTKKVSILFRDLQRTIIKNKASFIITSFWGIEPIINALYKDGWILGYKKYTSISDSYFEIYIKYDTNAKTTITNVKTINKSSLLPIIRQQSLISDCKNTAYTGIIQTAKHGFLSNRQALSKKTGGIYLAKVF